MSLLHDDPPPAVDVRVAGDLRVKYFPDGALGIIDVTTKQAMHLSPGSADQLIRHIRALDREQAVPSQRRADGKPTNPKDAIGSDKLPLHLWPSTATALGCLGLLDGDGVAPEPGEQQRGDDEPGQVDPVAPGKAGVLDEQTP